MTSSTPIADMELIASLQSMPSGEGTLFERLANVFQKETPELLQAIFQRCEGDDLESLAGEVHRLRGNCAVMGAARSSQVASVLLEEVRNGRKPPREAFEQLAEETARFLEILQTMMPPAEQQPQQ